MRPNLDDLSKLAAPQLLKLLKITLKVARAFSSLV
jgi:hypothetical protein